MLVPNENAPPTKIFSIYVYEKKIASGGKMSFNGRKCVYIRSQVSVYRTIGPLVI